MRTDVTLDDDVVSMITDEAQRTNAPFEEVLKTALRAGLMRLAEAEPETMPVAETPAAPR